MTDKRITIRSVSEYCGVSTATVSRVLNDNGRFSKETRDRVLSAVAALGYIPNASAKALRTDMSRLVGIFVNALDYEMTSTVVSRLEKYLFDRGYVSIVCNIGLNAENEGAYRQMLLSMNARGVFLLINRQSFPEQEFPFPAVYLYRDPLRAPLPENVCVVETDDFRAGYLAGRELVRLGLDEIGEMRLNHPDGNYPQKRHDGFAAALREDGREITREILADGAGFAELLRAADEAFAAAPPAQGYFCTSDLWALALIRSLEMHGYRVPEDVKVIGCNDMPLALYNNRPITTVRHRLGDICCAAVDLMERMLTGERVPESERRQVFGVELIPRSTT